MPGARIASSVSPSSVSLSVRALNMPSSMSCSHARCDVNASAALWCIVRITGTIRDAVAQSVRRLRRRDTARGSVASAKPSLIPQSALIAMQAAPTSVGSESSSAFQIACQISRSSPCETTGASVPSSENAIARAHGSLLYNTIFSLDTTAAPRSNSAGVVSHEPTRPVDTCVPSPRLLLRSASFAAAARAKS